ncbi:MAG TPA: plastocyanin/azurin family copper-binding protein [Actinomycetota bacterium]|nr:plastocyanin/azurin family copper-binding protein [Actinomycetota bacterium]
MMLAVAHRRPGRARAAHRLALLALVALVIGASLLLATGGRASAQSKNAEIDGTAQLKWDPADVTVPVGGTVTFKISGGPPHPVEAGKAPNAGGSPNGDNSFDTSKCQIAQMSKVGASCKITFSKAGTYPFFCQVHWSQGMVGTITVGKGGGTATTAAPATTSGAPTVTAPQAASGSQPPKPGVYWLGYALLGGGFLLAVAAVFGYLRFYPRFRRDR